MRSSPESPSAWSSSAWSPCEWSPPDLGAIERDAIGGVPRATVTPDGGLVLPDFGGLPGAPMRLGLPPPPDPKSDERYQNGYADGLRDGGAGARTQLRPLVAALEQAVDALNLARKELAPDHAQCVHAIAIAVARKLVQREMSTDPSVARSLVEQALGLMPLDAPFDVRLNPKDFEAFGAQLDKLHGQGRKASVEWIADATIERGRLRSREPRFGSWTAASTWRCATSTSVSMRVIRQRRRWLDEALARRRGHRPRFAVCGRVTRVIGQVVEVSSLPVAVGEVCRIAPRRPHGILAQVGRLPRARHPADAAGRDRGDPPRRGRHPAATARSTPTRARSSSAACSTASGGRSTVHGPLRPHATPLA